ncbi:hypothetical protein NP493_385g03030 [Ridgeia piscesae]|uniref:Uncharacterized protein n=1 Tax=Ridgeia piscesae TaxID=27915 RepID=A0AAD9NT06_RIDPI|nr:hypothetical protein NP493_385g03030 [Ridgeia piscesae]
MVPPHAEQLHFASSSAALLVSVMGVFDFVARLGVGWLADRNYFKKKHILHASLAVSGVSLFAVPLLTSYELLAVTLALSAVSGGTFVMMLARITRDHWMLKDLTGRWDASFFACGGAMTAVTLLYFVEPWALVAGRRRLDTKRPLP